MYMRFTTPGAVTRAGERPGLFRAAYNLRDALWPSPLAYAIALELSRLGAYHPVARGRRASAVRASRVWHDDGVSGSARLLKPAWRRPPPPLAALMQAGGVPVERIMPCTRRHPLSGCDAGS